jgi:hypothetical protein
VVDLGIDQCQRWLERLDAEWSSSRPGVMSTMRIGPTGAWALRRPGRSEPPGAAAVSPIRGSRKGVRRRGLNRLTNPIGIVLVSSP